MMGWVLLLIWIITLGFLFFFPVERYLRPPELSTALPAPINQVDGTPYGDYARGAPNAPIKITEYADLECPGCRRMHVELHDLLAQYEGKYSFVFRHFPLDNRCNPSIEQPFHLLACHAAMLARCGGEQGQYWESLDFLFQAEALEGTSTDPIPALETRLTKDLAHHLSIDEEALKSCIASGRQSSALRRDINEAIRVGLEATPSIWVNGKLIRPLSRQALVDAFETALKNAR
jgi:protein-disulfide isomerase